MTNEQIRKRCIRFLENLRLDPSNLLSDNMRLTESLYREAMAAGVRVASQVLSGEVDRLVEQLNVEADMLKGGAELKKPSG